MYDASQLRDSESSFETFWMHATFIQRRSRKALKVKEVLFGCCQGRSVQIRDLKVTAHRVLIDNECGYLGDNGGTRWQLLGLKPNIQATCI